VFIVVMKTAYIFWKRINDFIDVKACTTFLDSCRKMCCTFTFVRYWMHVPYCSPAFHKDPVRQLSFQKNYSPSKKNGRIFCKPSWWKALFKLLVPDPMYCPTLRVFMASNTLGRLRWDPVFNFRVSSWPQLSSGDSGETRPSLTYHDDGCYAIRYPWESMLNPCLRCRIGDTCDTDWSRNSTKLFIHNLHYARLHRAELFKAQIPKMQ
jgi:hypothetical protein